MSTPLKKILFNFEKLVLLLTLILLGFIELQVIKNIWTVYQSPWIVGVFLPVLVAFPVFFILRKRSSTGPIPYLLAIIGVFLALRIYWMWLVPTQLFSDFETYDRLARFFQGGSALKAHLSWRYYLYGFGYPLVLSIWYSIVGNSLFLAKVFNLLLGLASLLVFYRLGSMEDQRLGLTAAFLFTIWPAQWSYTNNIASEHLALLLFILALLVFFRFSRSGYPIIDGVILGIILSAAYVTRGPLIIVLMVTLGFLLISPLPSKKKMIRMGVILLGFSGFIIAYFIFMNQVYGIPAKTQGYSTLLMGTNFESKGMWNVEDGNAYQSFDTFEKANQYALTEAIRRIESAPKKFLHLMVEKITITWERDSYGVYWSAYQFEDNPSSKLQSFSIPIANAASDIFHFYLILLAMINVSEEIRRPLISTQVIFLALILLSGTFLHTIFEAQSRYHYWMEGILIFLAGLALWQIARGRVIADPLSAAA